MPCGTASITGLGSKCLRLPLQWLAKARLCTLSHRLAEGQAAGEWSHPEIYRRDGDTPQGLKAKASRWLSRERSCNASHAHLSEMFMHRSIICVSGCISERSLSVGAESWLHDSVCLSSSDTGSRGAECPAVCQRVGFLNPSLCSSGPVKGFRHKCPDPLHQLRYITSSES